MKVGVVQRLSQARFSVYMLISVVYMTDLHATPPILLAEVAVLLRAPHQEVPQLYLPP